MSEFTYVVRMNGYSNDHNGYLLFIHSSGEQHCPSCGCKKTLKDMSFSVTKNTLNERGVCTGASCNRKLRHFRPSLLMQKQGDEWKKVPLRDAFRGHSRSFSRALQIPTEEFKLKCLDNTADFDALYDNVSNINFDKRNVVFPAKINDRNLSSILDAYMNNINTQYSPDSPQIGSVYQPASRETVQTLITDWNNDTRQRYDDDYQPNRQREDTVSSLFREAFPSMQRRINGNNPAPTTDRRYAARRLDGFCDNCGSNPATFQLSSAPNDGNSIYYRCNICNHRYDRGSITGWLR